MSDTKPPDTTAQDPANLSYESALAELEGIIERIEAGKIGLEESIEAYRRGTKLLNRCRTILDDAQQQIETLDSADADKEP